MTGKIASTLLAFTCIAFNLATQTLPLRILPKPARALLADYVLIPGGTIVKNLHMGFDSLQFQFPKTVATDSFYMSRFEVTVADYVRFFRETDDLQNKYDSAVWTKDYPYSFNEPITRNYFIAPAFKQYPAVGMTWAQAVRYCQWKSEQVNALLGKSDYYVAFTLPTDTEWQYAAYGPPPPENKNGHADKRMFPWGADFLKGNFPGHEFQLPCNSGPTRTPQGFNLIGYPTDGGLYTVPVESYEPNGYGLYQMSGNVAEWTLDNYTVDTARLVEAQRAVEDNPEALKQFTPTFPPGKYDEYKIVKGGSWVDEPFYMQIGVVKIQHPERASSTVGFRPVFRIYRK